MMEEIAWEPMAGDFAEPVFCVTRQDFPPGKRIGMRPLREGESETVFGMGS